LACVAATSTQPAVKSTTQSKTAKKEVPRVLQYKMKSLSGQEVDLSKYAGKVTLIVDTASQCGYTKQYAGLQELHKKYAPQGLAVLGFPANNFGGQEPGTNEQISGFCKANYGVEFDMFSKVSVQGDDKAPLFDYLTSAKTNPKFAGEIGWNFEKFLIGRNGEVVARFKSGVEPTSDEMIKAIEAQLAKK
jgi:glutathione peroxidase